MNQMKLVSLRNEVFKSIPFTEVPSFQIFRDNLGLGEYEI